MSLNAKKFSSKYIGKSFAISAKKFARKFRKTAKLRKNKTRVRAALNDIDGYQCNKLNFYPNILTQAILTTQQANITILK